MRLNEQLGGSLYAEFVALKTIQIPADGLHRFLLIT